MKYARTFLSHSSRDRELVHAVAAALARRGVIAWLDQHELYPGQDLTPSLSRSIAAHVSVVVFLSEAALGSPWVDDELARALEAEAAGATVIPVFLDDAEMLVRRHPRLRARWMHADGDRVDRLGIPVDESGIEHAEAIAGDIARAVYQELGTAAADDVVLVLDQRGTGTRTGPPTFMPSAVERLDAPALVFRPDLGPRSYGEVLHGEAWERTATALRHALASALGTRRPTPPKIRIVGNAQLALPFLVGQQLNRTSGVGLYCYDRHGSPLRLSLAELDVPLGGGDTGCHRDHPCLDALPRLDSRTRSETISLLVMYDEGYVEQAAAFLAARGARHPVAWVRHPARIEEAGEIVTLARDLAALLRRAGTIHVELFTSLPFHAIPLLAALLTPHAAARVTIHEHDRNAPASESYRALTLAQP